MACCLATEIALQIDQTPEPHWALNVEQYCLTAPAQQFICIRVDTLHEPPFVFIVFSAQSDSA
jgi:hypothetical protein